VVGDPDDGIFALRLSRFSEPDWSWEGARAHGRYAASPEQAAYTWSGEVVGLDDTDAGIFVKADVGSPPCTGDFFVEPYEYLADLNRIFTGDLAPEFSSAVVLGLAGAEGSLRPLSLTLPANTKGLLDVWRSSWAYIWGPPGCGKTYTIGRQVAALLSDPSERVLLVSTTNKATDEVALSLGRGLREAGHPVARTQVARVGSGADIDRYIEAGLEEIVVGGEAWLRRRLAALLREYSAERNAPAKARLWAQIQAARQALSTNRSSVAEVGSRVVVATTFAAVRDLCTEPSRGRVTQGLAPFTTVVVDEGGLVSRVGIAALSCWAARRLVIVGDQRQLSPISKINRLLPSHVARWVACSGLAHVTRTTPATHVLAVQHRMHPAIRLAVSEYQYDGLLSDAPAVIERDTPLHPNLQSGPRAVWYVLDEDTGSQLPHIRAERGPGNRSWIRPRSREIVERLLATHPSLRAAEVLFITPFAAQARLMSTGFGELHLDSWRASTVHRQQGTEADVVIFDTVNAGSAGWAHDEWKRLINVGVSRARHLLVVLASRAEMRQPYLAHLAKHLAPLALVGSGGQLKWKSCPIDPPAQFERASGQNEPSSVGGQIATRKALRPILSAEQQRLCELRLDGKPRLIRGVAGSGKTAVLAHWVAKELLSDAPPERLWVVYANAALGGLLRDALESAWRDLKQDGAYPWARVELAHILDLLSLLETECHVARPAGDGTLFDFERRAEAILQRTPPPRCDALFLDEAQDFGHATLRLLAGLIHPRDHADPRTRNINIFYDNAQNVFGRGTPKWVDLGLDMRGRSTVMKESFRSTQVISEFALNVLYRLSPPDRDPDHLELVERQLIEAEVRNGRQWWRVRYNQVSGPAPDFRIYPDRPQEIDAICNQVRHLIVKEQVKPGDIRIVANDARVRRDVTQRLSATLTEAHVNVEEQAGQTYQTHEGLVIVTTAHSLKGHESEVVIVPAADKFTAKQAAIGRATLPHVLYVALTRARSLLYVSAITRSAGSPGAEIVDTLQASLEDLRSVPREAVASTRGELVDGLLEGVDPTQRDWANSLFTSFEPQVGPILRSDGSIVVEPLFWIESPRGRHAFLKETPTPFMAQELEDAGFSVLKAGTVPS
jgi:superfamily I DNA/RNA helicase